MENVQLLRVFLASPGDVSAERDSVEKIIIETNRTIGEANGVRVEVTRWETDTRAAWGRDGQAIINQLIEKRAHDAFVVLFWNRFGTPTPRAKSGTLEEFKGALKQRLRAKRGGARPPEIMLYFNDAPATFTTKKELEQRQAVLDFRGSIKDGLYVSYKGKAAFARKFREDYSKWLLEEIEVLKKPTRARRAKDAAPTPATPPAPKSSAPKPRAPRQTTSRAKLLPILLDDHLFLAEKVTESGDKWTLILRPQAPADDRKIEQLRQQKQYQQQFSIAYGLRAGRAQIAGEPERTSEDKGDHWKLDLRFNSARGSTNLYYQGASSQEVAEQKARWLLLAQEPTASKPRSPWETSNSYLIQQIKGHGAEAEPIFPALWQKVAGDRTRFAALATLVAVERLLNNDICEHIEELKIGAVTRGKVSIKFRGTRSDGMKKSIEFSVEGSCSLPTIK